MLDPDFNPYFADGDFELGTYRVEALAQQARTAYTRSAVFPHLKHVSGLVHALRGLLDSLEGIRGARPGPSADEAAEPDALAETEEFVRWACSRLDPLVHEGETILQFAQDNVYLEPVGVLPSRPHEGYLLVPTGRLWQAYRFTAYVLRTTDEAAMQAERIEGAEDASPAALKEALRGSFPDLPVPATFCVQTEFSFPAEATLLPVAGRKLPPLLWSAPGRA